MSRKNGKDDFRGEHRERLGKNQRPRLDQLLVEKGLFPSRQRAQAAILAGEVFTGERRLEQAGMRIDPDTPLEHRSRRDLYVSRGGFKLEAALDRFKVATEDRVFADIGASTGGFTDCLLKRGARRVYAIDVGYGQLAWNLRNDPRVVCMERINARYLRPGDLPELLDGIVIDVSFISLDKVLPQMFDLAHPHAEAVALVKPQFEAGPGQVGRGGVIRDASVRKQAVMEALHRLLRGGLEVVDLILSPIAGADGNVEYLAHVRRRRVGDQAGTETSRHVDAEAKDEMDVAGVGESEPAAIDPMERIRTLVEQAERERDSADSLDSG